MFNLVVSSILAIFGAIGVYSSIPEIHIAGFIFLGISILWFLISIIISLFSYTDQLQRFERLNSLLNKLEKYKSIDKDSFNPNFAYKLEAEIVEQVSWIRYYQNGKWFYIAPKIPENLKPMFINKL